MIQLLTNVSRACMESFQSLTKLEGHEGHYRDYTTVLLIAAMFLSA